MWRLFEKLSRTPLATQSLERLAQTPDGARGEVEIRPHGCEDWSEALRACPSGALSPSGSPGEGTAGGGPGAGGAPVVDPGRCLCCGACAEACPTGIVQTNRQPLPSLSRPGEAGNEAAAIRALLGRSLQIRHVDGGSCNGCDWEMTHLLNPVYDLQRFGIDFVASPRHADALLVTGPVTRHLEEAVRRTFDAAGEPKLVVAVGTCAISGGMVGTTYAARGGVDRVLPVAAQVPGCPPRPEAILHGILLAIGRGEAIV